MTGGAARELFLEIGCEEIPARFIPGALESLRETIAGDLEGLRLEHGEILTAGTPRRLAVCVRDVAAEQPSVTKEVTGPAKSAAYGPDGALTRAALGFARSQGVAPQDLIVKTLPKGEYVCAVRREEGRAAAGILREGIPKWVTGLRFPKSMRWGGGDLRFARPVHWIVALFGGEALELEVEGIRAGRKSRGHRFLSPGDFEVSGWEDYLAKTEGAMVIADHGRRKEMIRGQITAAARAEGGEVSMDEELLDTVTHLVEYPVAVVGSFEKEFLKLPEEVLVTSMKSHQKYFTVRDGGSRLMARFIAVSNMKCDDMALIRAGNERVLRARLSDAAFFFREDSKAPLRDSIPELDKVVYQERLGSYGEKVGRVSALARHLAEKTGLFSKEAAERAARLSKADLVTQMVGEFPELQGVMGREYARLSGETEEVARAVYEHYLPRFSGDALPETDLGALLSVADRIDSIAGIFGIGQSPTGSEDPYGLRRHTLAIINILTERQYPVDLVLLFEEAVCRLQGKVTSPAVDLLREIMEFFRGRLENLYVAAGFQPDTVRAVLAAGFSRLPEVRKKIEALEEFRKDEKGFVPLATAFKRAANIVPESFSGRVDEDLFEEEAERELHGAVKSLREKVESLVERGSYREALREMASIRPLTDRFFDAVLVMAKEESLRRNRLALLQGLVSLFAGLADFRQIAV